ncbi:MAG: hypothetical protein QM442_09215 [Spirochaetota bacterium]|nr:hypothetical protein [Spirochaetota bacterium]
MKGKGSMILLLLLLAGGGLLFAQTPAILIIAGCEAAEPIVFELQALLAEGLPRVVLTDDRKAILKEYDQEEIDRAFLAEQAQAYAKKQPAKPKGEALEDTGSDLPSTYASKGYDPSLLALFEREEALFWYMSRERALGVFLVDVTPYGQARRVRLLYQEGPRLDLRLIHDRLLVTLEERTLIEELLAQAVHILTDGTKAVLKIEGSKEIRIAEKMERIESLDVYLMPTDKSTVTVERSGHEPRKVAVRWEEGEVATIRPDLQRIVNEPVTLLSNVGAVRYSSEGEAGESGMITLGSPSYPIALSVEKEGFVKSVLHIPHETGTVIRFGVRKASVDVPDEQKRVYRRALGTILSFGSYVAAQALVAAYDPKHENPLWSLALGSTRLLSVVSSVAMIAELSSYASAVGMMQE